MKKLILLILVCFSKVALAEVELYTSDSKNPHDISNMSAILEKFTREYPEKNILFYVHGRNHHLEKEWNKLSVMENSYNVKVVMLHWDAWSSFLSRAVKNAELAAGPLSLAFKEVRDFKAAHPDTFVDRKINLLCHSMGNLVLKNFTENFLDEDNFNADTPLFDSFMSVSADVPLKDHKIWLENFNLAENKNVVMNNRDIVLLLSYTLDLKDKNPYQYRLGLGMDNLPGKRDQIKDKLVPDATYIDLSGVLKSQHGYFLPKTPLMHNIFSKLINGAKFSMSQAESQLLDVKINTDNNIFYVRDN